MASRKAAARHLRTNGEPRQSIGEFWPIGRSDPAEISLGAQRRIGAMPVTFMILQ
jgi:hypothetical protein